VRKLMRKTAGALALFVVMSVAPAAIADDAGTRYDDPIGAECAYDAESAIVSFDVEVDGEAIWSVTQDGKVLTYGEADNAPAGGYVLVVDIEPGSPVTAYANGDLRTFTCDDVREPADGPIAEVLYEPTVSPMTFLGWYRALYAKVLGALAAL